MSDGAELVRRFGCRKCHTCGGPTRQDWRKGDDWCEKCQRIQRPWAHGWQFDGKTTLAERMTCAETATFIESRLAGEGARDDVAALVVLASAGIPPDVQELLVQGDPTRGIAPGALSKALARPAPPVDVSDLARTLEAEAIALLSYGDDFTRTVVADLRRASAALTSHAEASLPVRVADGLFVYGNSEATTELGELLVEHEEKTAILAECRPYVQRSVDNAKISGAPANEGLALLSRIDAATGGKR